MGDPANGIAGCIASNGTQRAEHGYTSHPGGRERNEAARVDRRGRSTNVLLDRNNRRVTTPCSRASREQNFVRLLFLLDRAGAPAGEELDRGVLETFAIEGATPMRRQIHQLRPDGREPAPSERAFIETLCSCCAVSVAGSTVASAAA
jgi:hypothetical protein